MIGPDIIEIITYMIKDQIGDSDLKSKGDTNYNKDDGDQILYRRQDGRRYSLSLTYSF
ncbi:Uncharacterised protein [Sphingobacterium daejeonense]|nr:Uncharacterised protein [Sphingobacterium daejeonense]